MVMTRDESQKLFEQIKANSAALAACRRHRFEPSEPRQLFGRVTCLHCGGTIQSTDVYHYIRGYEAAGGSADDIWPGWHGAAHT